MITAHTILLDSYSSYLFENELDDLLNSKTFSQAQDMSNINPFDLKCGTWIIDSCLNVSNQKPLKTNGLNYLIGRIEKPFFTTEISGIRGNKQ